MLQALLEDRFKLRTRRETRNVPMYALTVAPGGSRLSPLSAGGCVQFDPANPPPARPPGPLCGSATNRPDGADWMFEAIGVPISRIVNLLHNAVDRPVVDRTGLAGLFNVRLDFSPEGTRLGDRIRELGAAGGDLPQSTAPPLVTALQDQLGLRLEAIRGPWEFLVIESIDRPTEN
jgi:uncharacterized protein (TIGR03435 family)